MSEEYSSTMKAPSFDGKKESFQMFWIRFDAFANVKNFERALMNDKDMPASAADVLLLDENDANDKKAFAAVKRNKVAWAQMTLALNTEALLAIMSSTKDLAWPGGLAHKVVVKLKEKYQPNDRVSRVKLRRRLDRVEMSKTDDPSELFEQIASIKNAFQTNNTQTVDEEDLLATVLEKAPEEYASILATEERSKGASLTLADLEAAMDTEYRIRYGVKGTEREKKKRGELSLSAFNGKCYNCQEEGHVARDCPKSLKDQRFGGKGQGKFKGTCNNCGKHGHKKTNCWQLEENKDKRPRGYKGKSERGLVTKESESSESREFLLMTKGFSTNDSILDDPNVFIADTGATSDTTPYDIGFKESEEASAKDAITDASGNIVPGNKIGKLHGKICDKFGMEKGEATISGIMYTPNSRFNLFSMTKRMQDG